ncbi:hypothetical protein MSIMFI_04928 [Mycobacterium simulans]|uniref:hypothetical protein n=1 Tax=Mycobacterium simulans TaxID=627089 RepID=UPI00174E0D37|nr:hypothetical protein [Mycobacterium simulans]SON63398.1 hypothetical protein MSIMFI_04928 [Mycobacterium simulans]
MNVHHTDSDNYSTFLAFVALISGEIARLDDHHLLLSRRVGDMKALLGPLNHPTLKKIVSVLDDINPQLEVIDNAIAHCRRTLMNAVTQPGSDTESSE